MRFRGTTEEGEVVEFKSYCKDSDHVIEYGSEIGIQKNIWKYVKKDSLICVEVEDLERQLAEARENIYKFAEIALMEGKDEFGHSWEDFKIYVLDEQLKEKGENE